MKAVFALIVLVAVIALSSAGVTYDNGNGEPSCISVNANQKFRNNWDPTRYWLCGNAGSAASSVQCPSETGFVESKKDCVSWAVWVWEVPFDPPTA